MEEALRQYAGREFSKEEISLIVSTTETYPNLAQSELAATVCELTGWVTASGRPKLTQCVGYLRQLEREGLIRLPEIKANTGWRKGRAAAKKRDPLEGVDMGEVKSCGAIELAAVRPGKALERWRGYLRGYHALGDPHVYGEQLRYMVVSEGRDLGCLLFSASSWALSAREEWIGWSAEEKKGRLHLIVNNSRFLILPWVRVDNLASRALSMAARRIQGDWLREYCYAPVLLETFVDAQYKGTSYKAANWIYLGETKGRGRNDRYRDKALTQKAIYVLPLQRDFRAVLKGVKPYKEAGPYEF